MNLTFSEQDEVFRKEVRHFLAENYPSVFREKPFALLEREDFLSWHHILYKQGWIAPSWPKEYGGPGWTARQCYIYQQELCRAGCILLWPFGIEMLGPVLMKFGTAEQKARYLPAILDGTDWWCQGYSEPGAGSDLAALKTDAVRDGDDYIINGQKIWTTMAHFATHIFCLVRTDTTAQRKEGISFIPIDLATKGIDIRPIHTIDGLHHVNEVFFQDVCVPVSNLIGAEGQGWEIAQFLLGNERRMLSDSAQCEQAIAKLKKIARAEMSDGRPLSDDSAFRKKLAEIEIDLLALQFTELNMLSEKNLIDERTQAQMDRQQGLGQGAHRRIKRNTGLQASLLKIKGAEIHMQLRELIMDAIGPHALIAMPYLTMANYEDLYMPGMSGASGAADISDASAVSGASDIFDMPDDNRKMAADAAQTYFGIRKKAIYGGSNEIQRNIIAKHLLEI